MRYAQIAGQLRRTNGWKKPAVPSRSQALIIPDIELGPEGGVDESMIPTPQDQGNVGDCTGQTAREVMTGLALKLGRGEELFSALYDYFWSRKAEGTSPTDDAGASVADAFEVIAARGLPFKASWDDDKPFSMMPPPEVDAEASEHRSLLSLALPNVFTMKASLALEFGFGFGFDVPAQMMTDACARSGLVEFPADPGANDAWDGGSSILPSGHAVSAWRWDDTKQIGQHVGGFLCLNHWSPRWGLEGRFWLPYKFFQAGRAGDAHTIRRAEV